MITVQNLVKAIFESKQIGLSKEVQRPKYSKWLDEASKNRLIKAVVGFRRSGKSYLLKMFSNRLIARGVPGENIFFLNFENTLLREVKTVNELRKIWEIYLQKIANINKEIYIIWDELQIVEGWEKLVRTLYEQDRFNIFISGSNSKLLSGELSSSLSGRSIELEVLPFSFIEYLKSQNIKYNNYYQNIEQIDHAFIHYLKRGGLPEQFKLNEDLATSYKDSLIRKVLLDDIIERYQIDKIATLKEVFDFVKGNITSTTSLKKIADRITSQGISVSIATIDNYLYYWQTSYALNKLTKYNFQLKRIFEKINKYYVIDNILLTGGDENDEKRLENLVYIELIRRYGRNNIYYAQNENGYEVDFLTNQEGVKSFFQVCHTLNDGNIKREFGNLKIIKNYLDGEGKILYLNDQRTEFQENNSLPVVEWLLEK
ncbi:hypothetical protein A2130_04480 [Candidatus Woesebacteria bacterium GWC2_33_12]|uniref:Uncharacterized protein n=1 Tax=Candidatus Woesebacteria bacterium GW2011_GWB1_33_22 TaxID=1618566 RepID=A0A0F9ZI77_9BACT|nr:MAG: hypothetical protein UR29_C0022G0005 [Candidatus Woesebacteria bacterium GW2011_GWC2_33_12]KKP41467.1 MAG: hypothetical protein UR33_C0015G0006 [Candidatus Woesebacteria bacterium GW2011_GWA2_33_20]KKP43883.1 MAG: hypothetical protein UR35_C0015G0006 [Candidatus Woesebacteria bacterium GW2011_GWB1_33_22]KKP45614.1 MAG: hypothetical protein UR37_C0017G0006 [Microgenomates group bacterium GW2011_GWC1_33_28]KKP49345.1 MAG: hypothetical protein UR41_C0016G0006 [Candidatus Woesebacteria bact